MKLKKILSLALAALMIAGAFSAAIPASAAKTGFSDVEDGRWSAPSVQYAVDNGYMKGVGGGKFDPEGSLTRAMVATVLWRREGEPKPTAPSGFSDVPANEWYADAVAWAKETGVVKGITEKTFEPDGKITREQLATMLFRFSSSAPVEVTRRADLSPFSDDEKVSDWAVEPLEWAAEAGLIKGTDGNRLAPGDGATREQFAAIIERYDNSFTLKYNEPVVRSQFREPDYPLVDDADFYVSTNGDDSADGSLAHPFRTWERARDAVRALDKTGRDGITVAFKAGDYGPLSVRLTAEDSGSADCPITYCKYGDGDVVFTGGFDVPESDFSVLSDEEKALFTAKAAEDIRRADISDRLAEYDPRTVMAMNDDGDLTLARFPNKYADGSDNLLEGSHENIDDTHIRIDNYLILKKLEKYRTTEGLLLYGYLTTGWYKDLLGTADYDPETHVFRIPRPEQARMGYLRRLPEFDSKAWSKVAVVNVSEELDAAGEFWIDPDAKVFYVYSPSGDYHFTGGSTMLTLEGTEYITLRGIDFKNCDERMIQAVDHPRGLTIEYCSFAGNAGDYMVNIEGFRSGVPLDVTVRGCDFSTSACAQLAIRGGSSDDPFNTGANVLVDNNYFTRSCLREGNRGSLEFSLPSAHITHNVFRRLDWKAISFGGSNMLADYNVFDEVCVNGDDVGAFQDWRDVTWSGNTVRYNLFMNIKGGTNGRYGLYLDGSSGTTAESNIFYNCPCPVMNNGLSKLNFTRNNVFISPDSAMSECVVHAEGHWLADRALATGDYSEILGDYAYQIWKAAFDYYDAHPAVKAKALEMWPEYFEITMDLDRIGEAESFLNSSVVCTGNISIKAGEEFGRNEDIDVRHSTFEDNTVYTPDENPLFVNPTAGDYRMKDGVGFPKIPYSKIGRYDPEAAGARFETGEKTFGSDSVEYAVRYPEGYDEAEKNPLLIFLHGSGTNGGGLENLFANVFFTDIETIDDFPFVVLALHLKDVNDNWTNHPKSVTTLIKEAVGWRGVDEKRVYLMGTSLGGEGTWFYAARTPELFAAAVPICGNGSLNDAKKLVDVPIWAHHGDLDDAMPYQNSVAMVDMINKAGGSAKLTTYYGEGHGIWSKVYSNPEVYEWLLSFRKG
ncbi:MAG: S-layer homology domain-containing protein [Clostridia bacterium]|nr:S-layer homology domain-containing protein [Clostridia bacterium]